MKRLIIAFSLLFAAVTSYSANYSIFKLEGEVSLKRKESNLWVTASRRDTLAVQDLFKLTHGASVTVINKDTGQLFKSTRTGEMSVYEIITRAKSESAKITSLVCQEFKSEIKDYYSGNNDMRVGAVYRGESDMHLLDSLAGHWQEDTSVAIGLASDDETLYFVLENVSSGPKYVNVVRIAPDGKKSVCLEFKPGADCEGLLLPSGAHVALPQYRFLPDGSVFKAFSSAFPFDTRALQRRL